MDRFGVPTLRKSRRVGQPCLFSLYDPPADVCGPLRLRSGQALRGSVPFLCGLCGALPGRGAFQILRGMGLGNPTSRKGRETWGTRGSWWRRLDGGWPSFLRYHECGSTPSTGLRAGFSPLSKGGQLSELAGADSPGDGYVRGSHSSKTAKGGAASADGDAIKKQALR